MNGKTIPTTEPSLNQVGRVMEEFWHPNAGMVDGNRMAREIAALRNAGCEALLRVETLTSELLTTAQQLAASREQLTAAERALDNIAQSVGVALAAIYGGDAR